MTRIYKLVISYSRNKGPIATHKIECEYFASEESACEYVSAKKDNGDYSDCNWAYADMYVLEARSDGRFFEQGEAIMKYNF